MDLNGAYTFDQSLIRMTAQQHIFLRVHETDQCTMWIESNHTYQHKQVTSICWIDPNGRPTARDSVSGGPPDPAP
jgi:hypothetical protein